MLRLDKDTCLRELRVEKLCGTSNSAMAFMLANTALSKEEQDEIKHEMGISLP